ncbi:MAG: hypothetical protein K6T91_03625 [Firmicutes bacterium]|nr:hypothetical protein [Bacillota bacterium]
MPASEQWWSALEAVAIFIFWAVGIYLVVNNIWWRKSASGDDLPEVDIKPAPIGIVDEYEGGLEEAHGDPPLALKLFIGLFIAWMIGYIVIYYVRQG